MNSRMIGLLGLLALALIIRVVDPWKMSATNEVVQAKQHTAAPGIAATATSPEPASEHSEAGLAKPVVWPVRAPIEREFIDPFGLPVPPTRPATIAQRIVVPVQAAPVNLGPPPPPQVPPLPFTPVGHWSEDDKIYAFVASTRGTSKIQAGDVIDSNYRVDEIIPGRITLTYLPLNQRQQLTWALSR